MGLIAHKGILYGGGIDAISEASDVALTTPSDGDVIEYDGTEEKWVNGQLATVAKTGAYSDLSGTPTIPTVNNGQLTIQKNGSNVATFTANQSGNATANIVVPTKTSDITNDSGYITEADTEVESLPDTTPYLYRKSPAIGSRVMENALVGASVVVNQLVDSNTTSVTIASGHKYIAKINSVWSVGASDGTAISVDGSRGDIFVDLTQYFGSSTIPDAAYTKEQSTAGSGIAWLKDNGHDFSKYIPYNTGTLESVNPSGKKVVGINRLENNMEDGSTTEYTVTVNFDGTLNVTGSSASAKIIIGNFATGFYGSATGQRDYKKHIPNGSYKFLNSGVTGLNAQVVGYNDDGVLTTIATGTNFTIDDTYKYNHVRLYATAGSYSNAKVYPMIYSADISSPTYEPYTTETYPISPSPLRGLFVLDGDSIKASGDVRNADGKTNRKYVEIDLGEQDWSSGSTAVSGSSRFYTTVSTSIKRSDTTNGVTSVCKYIALESGGTNLATNDGYTITASNDIYFYVNAYKAYTTEQFKAAMSGVKLVAELATPTTETLTPFDNPQISIVGGTEEFITNTDVPVGHESEYKALPALFEDDYIQYLQTKVEKGNPWKKQYRISNGYAIPNYNEIERLYTDMVLILQNGSNYVGSAFYPAIYGVPLYVGGTYSASGWVANDGTVSLTNASYMHVYLR